MKSLSFAIAIISILSGFSSCKHCNHIENVSIPSYAEDFFSIYKPGNYFIFLNQDSTKYDSIYVTKYNTSPLVDDRVACTRWAQLSFSLNSPHLSADTILNVAIATTLNCCDYSIKATSSDRTWLFYAKQNTDTLYLNIHSPPLLSEPLNRVINYQLWNNPEDTLAYVIPCLFTGQGTIYFTPQKGIVKYVTNNQRDSFTLVKSVIL